MNNFTCPYNSFCAGRAIEACNDTAMMDCPECNYGSYVALMFIASVLAVMIILGNSLTIWIFAQRCKNGCDMKMDAIKLSLAVSDLLTGKSKIVFFFRYFDNDLLNQDCLKCGPRLVSVFSISFFQYPQTRYSLWRYTQHASA